MWDEVDPKVGEQREKELREIHWKPMIDRGSTVEPFQFSPTSAFKLLRQILILLNEVQSLRPKEGNKSHFGLRGTITDLVTKLGEMAGQTLAKGKRVLNSVAKDVKGIFQ